MENFGDRTNYARQLGRVIAHIYDHLDDDLDLDALAEVACLSPHHWHRIYHALYGETAAATVKRLRLQRAAAELSHSSLPIEEIGARAGYPSLPSFTRTFKAAFGLPPALYRAEGSHRRFDLAAIERAPVMYDVTIHDLPPQRLAALPHQGAYLAIGRTFDALFTTLGARNLITPDLMMAAVFPDDPTAKPEEALQSWAGVVIADDFPVAAPLQVVEVRGGPYAVLRHQGPYPDMKAAYDWLYGEWLVRSGREAADAPGFETYLNSPKDTAPADLLADLHLPLR
jgi:AraC family transcriptional regulator